MYIYKKILIMLLLITGILINCTENETEENNPVDPVIEEQEATIDLVISMENKPLYDITTRTEYTPLNDTESFVSWMLDNTDQAENFLRQKWERAAVAIKWRDLTQPKVIEAFLYTPREYFCREKNRARAYEHTVLDIGYGQTISGPHCVAKMTDELELEPKHRVLEIGTGSGYQSAVLAQLSNWVYTIEVIEPLAQETELIYQSLEDNYPELKNIHRKIADGYYGWEEYAPFDRIIVTCGIDHKPPPLLKQLAVDGIMLIPVGPPMGQHVLKIRKTMNEDGSIKYTEKDIYNGMVVPFVDFTVDGTTRHSVERDKPGT